MAAPMDYESVIATFTDEFAAELVQRQAHLLGRVARFNADGCVLHTLQCACMRLPTAEYT